MKTQRSPSATWQHDNANQNGALWQRESNPPQPATSSLLPEKTKQNKTLPARRTARCRAHPTGQPANQPTSLPPLPADQPATDTATLPPSGPSRCKNKKTNKKKKEPPDAANTATTAPAGSNPSRAATTTTNLQPLFLSYIQSHPCFAAPPLSPIVAVTLPSLLSFTYTHRHTHT